MAYVTTVSLSEIIVLNGKIDECFVTKIRFHSEEFLVPRPNPKLEYHPFSAVRDCLFNIFAAILHIWGRSSIRNLRNLRERNHWGDPSVDGRIILRWGFRKWDVGVWTGLGWLRIEIGGGHLWMRQWTLGLHKMRGIYLLAENRLASQEGLCCMEWVSEW
jgi:hypothetical protein